MEVLGIQLQKILVRLSDKGFNLKWNNNEITSWYSAEGARLKSKSKYKKIPAAIVYLLRRNDLATMTENEKTITNIKEIERVRSDELQKLRKQVEMFAYECKKGPGWNDPMTAVVPRVKGFACYDLSFSRHNKNIKMEHFFLYILSRYFI